MIRNLAERIRLRLEEMLDSILWRNFSLFGNK